ncbi:MAG: RnfABCDGE type electron transport complex subunit B [Chitinispirillia bacterium]|nr:RnfABCDGE type electron transport complex subunit B [Chitinispirillia bacterium]MCL2242189.1 RnfABCDGE type electron transport complex subunit B [Chitinispirillia bacterium]
MEMMMPMFVAGGIGLVFAIGLGIASRTLQVFVDPKVPRVQNALPGANCGACGHPGCSAFAKAVVEGKAQAAACIPGGEKTVANIADILGVTAQANEPMMAVVHCKGGKREALDRSIYNGLPDCHVATLIGNGSKTCPDGCLGLGTCVKACIFDAIKINENNIAVVDHEKCVGCGKCVSVCPRNIISMIPQIHKVYLACSNHDRGAPVKKYCSVGCTACTLCVKATVSGAITIEENLPKLDYSGNEIFIIAHAKCPVKCFVDLTKMRPKANIDTKCNGCGECAEACPMKNVISGEPSKRHVIDKNKCIGCGTCLNICPVRAITLWGGLGYDSMERQKRQRYTSTEIGS